MENQEKLSVEGILSIKSKHILWYIFNYKRLQDSVRIIESNVFLIRILQRHPQPLTVFQRYTMYRHN